MHSLSRHAPRAWTLTSATTCQTFSTYRPSMGDSERKILPYQSVGWLSVDLKNVKHEPWMNVRQATFGEDERIRRIQERRKRERQERETGRAGVEENNPSREEETIPDFSPSQGPSQSVKPKVTAMSGALTLAKSSLGLRRNIGRDLLPSFTDGLPRPAAKPDYTRRARRFVPIANPSATGPSEQSQESSSSLSSSTYSTRQQSRHPQSLDGHDESLEEYFGDHSRRDLAMPYLDTDEYAVVPKSKRKVAENVSGMPEDEWKQCTEKMLGRTRDDGSEADLDGLDDRPDFIPIDPSRLPRVGTISHLPKAADIAVGSSIPDRPPRSGRRLWRSSPIILSHVHLNQRRPL